MTRADLEALARRCETERASFELERAIMYAVFNVPPAHQSAGDKPKPYTSSLDAAVSLYIKKPPTISSDPRLVAADALRARAAMEAA